MVGPVFFEFIQRKGDEGFGEGNITAHVQVDGGRPVAARERCTVSTAETDAAR